MQFVDIGNSFFCQNAEVKYIVSADFPHSEGGFLYKLIQQAKKSLNFIKYIGAKPKSFVVLSDNCVIASPLIYNSLKNNLINSGTKFIEVIPEMASISVSHINMVQSGSLSMTVCSKRNLGIKDDLFC